MRGGGGTAIIAERKGAEALKKRVRYDALLIAAVLGVAAVLWLAVRPGGQGAAVLVLQDGEEIARYALDQDRTVTIGEADYNILEIRDGQASVVDANCGDHTCVRTGAVSRAGQRIICLPHRLEIRVMGGADSGVDITVG